MIEICEHESSSYAPRTKLNGNIADATLALAFDLDTHGEKLTKKCAGSKYIGFLINEKSLYIDIVKNLYGFMVKKNARTLNIAGNGIYTLNKFGCSQRTINYYVYRVLKKLNENHRIEKVYTGGQTGVDLAGAVSAYLLGIDVVMTLPKGYKQRFEDGIDVYQTKEDIQIQLDQWRILLYNDLYGVDNNANNYE